MRGGFSPTTGGVMTRMIGPIPGPSAPGTPPLPDPQPVHTSSSRAGSRGGPVGILPSGSSRRPMPNPDELLVTPEAGSDDGDCSIAGMIIVVVSFAPACKCSDCGKKIGIAIRAATISDWIASDSSVAQPR